MTVSRNEGVGGEGGGRGGGIMCNFLFCWKVVAFKQVANDYNFHIPHTPPLTDTLDPYGTQNIS